MPNFDEPVFSAIIHNKTSYKRFIIQQLQSNSLARCEKTCLTGPLENKYRVIFELVLGVLYEVQLDILFTNKWNE